MSTRRVPVRLLGSGTAIIAALALSATACGGSSDPNATVESSGATSKSVVSTTASSGEPIVIGLAAATSGAISGYDVPALTVLKHRVKEINAAGGVDGRKIQLLEANTQSDPAIATNVATGFIDKGADAIFTSCDFDFGSPAALVAVKAKIPAVSLCAGDPKFADRKTLGKEAFTFAVTSDAEGVSAAEWAHDQGWTKTYLLQDESIEYTKSVGRYFEARWKQLGGKIVGSDTFPGGENVNVSAQVTKMGRDAKGADFIFLPSWLPGGGTAIKQIRDAGITTPIVTGAAMGAELLFKITGPLKDVYSVGLGCFKPACTGTPTPAMDKWAAEIKQETGDYPPWSSLLATDVAMQALAAAFKAAGPEADGEKIAGTLGTMPEVQTLAGPVKVATPTCNRPVTYPHYVVTTHGESWTFLKLWQAQEIPDIGDGNACVTR